MTNNTLHVSLDLETWGTRPGFDLRSIGACVFDPMTGYAASPDQAHIGAEPWFYLATDNPRVSDDEAHIAPVSWMTKHWDDTSNCWRKYPLKRDPSTVQWWTEQTDEAQAAFADPVDLREALERFSNWLCDIVGGIYVPSHGLTGVKLWSHGAAFDPGILAEAYHAVGLAVPWHYRAPRDTRTAFDMAGIEDHSAWLAQHPGPLGITHHALDDAICQARAVCGVFDILSRCVVAPRVDNP